MSEKKSIGLCGCGYWGKNLARCFNELGVLKALYDTDPDRARSLPYQLPCVWSSFEEFLENVSSIAIATPPETHYTLAAQALAAGKHVFMEKPMTTSYEEALMLNELAEEKGLNLMVGHIYLHNPGLMSFPVPVGRADLYIQLINDKGPPSESTRDLFWAGLPHAVSVAYHFFPDGPLSLDVVRTENCLKAKFLYWNGSTCYIEVGDYTGRKLRKVELDWGNSRYMFDVSSPNYRVVRSGVEVRQGEVGNGEPLFRECEAFLEYHGVDPLGAKVVKLIEDIRNSAKTETS